MTGADLKCDCGARARDVAPDYEIGWREAVQWHCENGHLLITGWRDLTEKHEQMRFPEKPAAEEP